MNIYFKGTGNEYAEVGVHEGFRNPYTNVTISVNDTLIVQMDRSVHSGSEIN